MKKIPSSHIFFLLRQFKLFTLLILGQFVSGQSITWIECPLPNCNEIPASTRFGQIKVPLSYNFSKSDSTSITFAIVKAKEKGKDDSPLLFFQGNWKGESLHYTGMFPDIFQIYDRDIILYDERFAGYSGRPECKWVGEAAWDNYRKSTTLQSFLADQLNLFTKCLDSLELKAIRPHQYLRSTKTKDIITLAKKLGYTSYNLMGVSNGTRSVQMFLKESERASIKVRSVILDSPVPLGVPLLGEYLATYHTALMARLKSLQREEEYYEILSNWTEPVTINWEEKNFNFTPYKFNDLLETQLYFNDQRGNIALIVDAVHKKQWSELDSFIHNLRQDYLNLDAHFIVDILAFQKNMREENVSRYKYLNDSLKLGVLASNFGSLKFYETMDKVDQDPVEEVPIKSDIPAFILVGEHDPVTPDRIANPLRSVFTNNHYLIVPDAGHGIAFLPSVVPQIKKFLENPELFIQNLKQ